MACIDVPSWKSWTTCVTSVGSRCCLILPVVAAWGKTSEKNGYLYRPWFGFALNTEMWEPLIWPVFFNMEGSMLATVFLQVFYFYLLDICYWNQSFACHKFVLLSDQLQQLHPKLKDDVSAMIWTEERCKNQKCTKAAMRQIMIATFILGQKKEITQLNGQTLLT